MSVNRNVTVPVGSSLTLIPAPRSAVGDSREVVELDGVGAGDSLLVLW